MGKYRQKLQHILFCHHIYSGITLKNILQFLFISAQDHIQPSLISPPGYCIPWHTMAIQNLIQHMKLHHFSYIALLKLQHIHYRRICLSHFDQCHITNLENHFNQMAFVLTWVTMLMQSVAVKDSCKIVQMEDLQARVRSPFAVT